MLASTLTVRDHLESFDIVASSEDSQEEMMMVLRENEALIIG
jgi:hypothetical protein